MTRLMCYLPKNMQTTDTEIEIAGAGPAELAAAINTIQITF
ncbi:MAG: hypothetical protein ACC653_05225 [Gammaproteobacteria bacterium]